MSAARFQGGGRGRSERGSTGCVLWSLWWSSWVYAADAMLNWNW